MSAFPKRSPYDSDLLADEAGDKLARALEFTPDVVRYSVGPVPDPCRLGEIYVTVTFRTGRGRDARFAVTVARAAALDMSEPYLIRFFGEHMRRFVGRHDERINKAIRTLPCGHYDATDDALREKLPCAQCASGPELEALDSGGMPTSWWPSDSGDAPDDRPVSTIHFRRAKFVLPTGAPVTRWEREELDVEDEPDEDPGMTSAAISVGISVGSRVSTRKHWGFLVAHTGFEPVTRQTGNREIVGEYSFRPMGHPLGDHRNGRKWGVREWISVGFR